MDTAAAMLIIKDVVQHILVSKGNDTYDKILSKCKLHIAGFLKSIHPKKDHKALLKKLEQFDKLPGSYQISCFLACFDGDEGFDLAPSVSTPPTPYRSRCQLFPPLVPLSKGIKSDVTFYRRVGLDYKASLKKLWDKDFKENMVAAEINGRNIYNQWPADMMEAIYMTIDAMRPVRQCDLQSDEWWEARGYMLLEHGIESDFFAPGDYTIKDYVIFPLRLLESKPGLLEKHTAMIDEDPKIHEDVEADCILETMNAEDSDDSDKRDGNVNTEDSDDSDVSEVDVNTEDSEDSDLLEEDVNTEDSESSDLLEEDGNTEFSEGSDLPEDDFDTEFADHIIKDPKCSDTSKENPDGFTQEASIDGAGKVNVVTPGADHFMEGLDDLFGEW